MPDSGVAKSMTGVMLRRYFNHKRSRLLLVLVSVIIGSATLAAVANVYQDIDAKMRKELRAYGANLTVRKTGDSATNETARLSGKDIANISTAMKDSHIIAASPYLYGIAEWENHRFAVLGADVSKLNKLAPYLIKSRDRGGFKKDIVLIGKSLAAASGLKPGDEIVLKNPLKPDNFLKRRIALIIETGDGLDDQLVTDIEAMQVFLGQKDQADLYAVSFLGSNNDLETAIQKLRQLDPGLKVSPINKISRAEGSFLEKISALTLFVSAAIFISAVLATAITLSSIVFERRYEIGIKKAVGASNNDIVFEFAVESLITGIAGGLIGWIAGIGIAQVIGLSLFSSYISIRIPTIIMSVVVALMISGCASIFPLRAVLNVRPAIVLRNE